MKDQIKIKNLYEVEIIIQKKLYLNNLIQIVEINHNSDNLLSIILLLSTEYIMV